MIICKSINIVGSTGIQYSLSIYPIAKENICLEAVGVFLKLEDNVFIPQYTADLNDYYNETPVDKNATHLAILMEERSEQRAKILADIDGGMKRKK